MRITGPEHINEGVNELIANCDVLRSIISECGPIPLRLAKPGFAGLASIIVSQQVSRASATAIFARLEALINPLVPETFLAAGEEVWKQAGLSRPKQRTLQAVSNAVLESGLDLENLCEVEPASATDRLVAIHGIGPWTAEIYLMFCAGHRDIFPAGDLALQEAIKLATGSPDRPGEKATRQFAERWTPWRSVAARILWDYYRVLKRDALPV